jgi:hypothetical protein
MQRFLSGFLTIFLISGSVGCAALGPLSPLRPVEQALIYPGAPPDSRLRPEDGGEEVWITGDDGVRLHGRYYHHSQPRAVALFCHGNAGSVADWSYVARSLNHRHQLAALVFDYRGYGRSTGSPSESGILRDGRAARRWLAERAGVREPEVLVMGRSLGGAVAVDLAADGARGLVLESTFSSLPDVAAAHASWLVPHVNMTQRLNSAARIAAYDGPLLQSHGDADTLIPLKLAQKLHAAAPGPKRLVVIPGANHNDPQSEAYEQALDEFIDALPPVATVALTEADSGLDR